MKKSMMTMMILAAAMLSATADNPALNQVKKIELATGKALTIVQDGKAGAVVVIPKLGTVADMVNSKSAAELILYVEKITGVKLPLFQEGDAIPEEINLILIGEGALARKYGINGSDLSPEGFRVKSFDGGLAIVGQLPEQPGGGLYASQYSASWGTLFGVYDFLERFGGVRWYYPDDSGVVIPQKKEWLVEPIHYVDAPHFAKRIGAHWGFFKTPVDTEFTNQRAFSPYFRSGDSSFLEWGVHSPANFGTHAGSMPECFEMASDGSRSKDFPCYGNPATVELMFDDLVNFYENGVDTPFLSPRSGKRWCEPTAERIIVSPPDKPVACMCAFCRKLWQPEQGALGNAGLVMTYFVTALAQKIQDKWPEKKVLFTPYMNFTICPEAVKLSDNVVIMLTKMYGSANGKEPMVEDFYRRQIDAWSRASGNKVITYEYSCWPAESTFMPFQYPHVLQKFYRETRDKIYGSFIDGHPSQLGRRVPADTTYGGEWAYSHLNFYLWYRLLWNPDFNVDAATNEYCMLMYGAAAKEMRQIFSLLADRYEQVLWKEKLFDNTLKSSMIYAETLPEAEVKKLDALYRRALTLVAGDPMTLKRVQFLGGAIEKCLDEARQFHTHANPTMLVKKVGSNPTIDGVPGDREFNGIPGYAFRPALDINGKPGDPKLNEIRAVWTKDGISIAILNFTAFQPIVTHSGRDSAVYEDECVDLFIQGTSGPAYHLIVNADGVLFDELGNDTGFNLDGVKTAVSKWQKNHWYAEIFLPFASLEKIGVAPEVNAEYSGNFARKRYFEHNAKKETRLYRWSTRFHPANNDPNAFGAIRLVE